MLAISFFTIIISPLITVDEFRLSQYYQGTRVHFYLFQFPGIWVYRDFNYNLVGLSTTTLKYFQLQLKREFSYSDADQYRLFLFPIIPQFLKL